MIDFEALLGEQLVKIDDAKNGEKLNYLVLNYETMEYGIDETTKPQEVVKRATGSAQSNSIVNRVFGYTQDRFMLRLHFYRSGGSMKAAQDALRDFKRVTVSRVRNMKRDGQLFQITHVETGISMMTFRHEGGFIAPVAAFRMFFNTNIKHRVKANTASEWLKLVLDEMKKEDFTVQPVGSDELCRFTDVNQTIRDHNFHSANKAVTQVM